MHELMKHLLIIFAGTILINSLSFAQDQALNTLKFDETKGSPTATLHDIAWVAGHWRGEAFGGITEELWSPPIGGSMMCAFKLVKDDQVSFYEIVSISEEDNTLILRLKHFNQDLTGWEEKNETVDFRLVEVTKNKVYFDGFTFEYISENEMNIYVVVDDSGKEEVKFNYKRVK